MPPLSEFSKLNFQGPSTPAGPQLSTRNDPEMKETLKRRAMDKAKVIGGGRAGKWLGGAAGALLGATLGDVADLSLPEEAFTTLSTTAGGRHLGKLVGQDLAQSHVDKRRAMTLPEPKMAQVPAPLKAPSLPKAPSQPSASATPKLTKADTPDVPEVKEPSLKMDPLPHQKRVSKKLQDPKTPGQVAYHGLGTGKTFTAISAAKDLNAPLIAVTPASLRNNMKKEIAASGFSNPYHVMSYEQALKKLDDPTFQAQASDALVTYDEAHRAGRAESMRSHLPQRLNAKKKLFLSGTPIRNDPHEVAPLVNAIEPGSLPSDPKEFKKQFIETREVPVGFWGRLKGVKPGKEQRATNLHEFEKGVKGKIDYHENVDRGDFPSFSESIVEVPMSKKQHASYNFTMGKYPSLAYKIKHGLPLTKRETKNFRSFMIGPRQVSNFPGSFNESAKDKDAAKITKSVDEIAQRHEKDPNYRGVTFSSFLDSGVHPVSRELERRGIPHAIFTGEQDDAERKKIIEDYNTGKIKQLLISGAGAEGLDLKGTKLMQILEPHWNEELIDQVRGRAIRYKSHAHLPDDERHVEVQRFHATPRKSLTDKLMRRTKPKQQGSDEYLYNLATQKRRLNDPFIRILKGESAEDVTREMQKNSELDFIQQCKISASKFAASLGMKDVSREAMRESVSHLDEPMPELD